MTDLFPPLWHPSLSDAWILDWDGVLADTKLNFLPFREKYFAGRQVAILEELKHLSPDVRERAIEEMRSIEIEGARRATCVGGAVDLIAWLDQEKRPWAIVSRNCRESIECAAERMGFTLPQVVMSRESGPVKPDPEALWNAASSLGVGPERCVMVGDFVYDLIGARRAGIRAVLVERPGAAYAHWADIAFDSVRDLVSSLGRPEACVPWEYLPVVRNRGVEWLMAASRVVGALDTKDPEIVRIMLEAASLGVLSFIVPPESVLEPEHFRASPVCSPSNLGEPLADVLQSVLRNCYPMAKVCAGTEGIRLSSFEEEPWKTLQGAISWSDAKV